MLFGVNRPGRTGTDLLALIENITRGIFHVHEEKILPLENLFIIYGSSGLKNDHFSVNFNNLSVFGHGFEKIDREISKKSFFTPKIHKSSLFSNLYEYV